MWLILKYRLAHRVDTTSTARERRIYPKISWHEIHRRTIQCKGDFLLAKGVGMSIVLGTRKVSNHNGFVTQTSALY